VAESQQERRERIEALADKGFELLGEGEHLAALKVAEELKELRYSAAFDIGAQAYCGLGDIDSAIRMLEEGLEKAPDCWLNWQLLGNYRSDLEKYEEAKTAYERALECPNASKSSIYLNQAIVANRQDNYAEALEKLDRVEDPDLQLEAASVRVSVLEDLGRVDEALALAEKTLAEHGGDDADGENLGLISAALGRMQLKRGHRKEEVRDFVVHALRYDCANSSLLHLIREIDDQHSALAQYYRLMVHVRTPEDFPEYEDIKGYFVTYDVVAESLEQALQFLQGFVSAVHPGNAEIEETEVLEEHADQPLGVYWRSGRCYYDDEE
jgi:tetratricopeptide (TPR) repeat protein